MMHVLRQNQVCDVLRAMERLLPATGADSRLKTLPITISDAPQCGWVHMALPEWASDLVPDGHNGLLVPDWGDQTNRWNMYDWWRAAHTMLTSTWERSFEASNGPVHSYSSKLGEEIQPIFDYAWVNRIVLFLRRWWAIENSADENEIFGQIPAPVLYLTHDVDAVSKTLAIRTKQAAFCTYNRQFRRATKFLLGSGDYWQFDHILKLEHAYCRRSIWNVYGGKGGWLRNPKEILMDPDYNVAQSKIQKQLKMMVDQGHQIGLHPKFNTWKNSRIMQAERDYIASVIDQEVTLVRQHWLRFSFECTWLAQAKAGLKHDMTLGFNDRSGFRNSAAVTYKDASSGMKVTPMVLMDSHLYDHKVMDQQMRHDTIDRVLNELVQTGGEASVIWHQRVFHADYGWDCDYFYLLKRMDELGFKNL